MTRAVDLANSVANGVSLGFKNRIINGAMVIDQRYAGAATANTINGYTVDRWAVLQSTTGKLIAQQNQGSVTPPAGFTNYLGVTSQSAYSVLAGDIYRFVQQIEGLNVADLGWGTANAQTVTLSFWVRSSLTGTFGGAIGNNTGASTYPFTYTISSANTWEQKTLTIPGPTFGTYATNNTTSIYLQFALGLGSSTAGGTANTWGTSAVGGPTGTVSVVGTNGATWYITGVQLEVGSTATNFEYRDYGRELYMCQRYYYRLNADGGNYGAFAQGYQAGLGGPLIYPIPQIMRTTPSATKIGSIINNFSGSGNPTVGGFLVYSGYPYYGDATGYSASFSGGCFLRANNDVTARIEFSAEL